MDPTLTRVLVLLAAYLLGAIPFSYLVARTRGVDVRRVGSGNVGATNVLRSVSVAAGLLAFVLDAGKGAVAVVLARLVEPGLLLPVAAGVAAVLGHMYPVWLRFRGGKGVATGAGIFLPLVPFCTIGALATFGLVLAATRYVSLASMLGAASLGAYAFLAGASPLVTAAAALLAALIAWKHRANVRRLLRGTESRMGRKGAAPAETR
jgi:acyl phosphate:glycerol-3-phosphate acyltransferase